MEVLYAPQGRPPVTLFLVAPILLLLRVEFWMSVPIPYELGFFFSCEHLVPNSVLFFTKEITKYQDENSEKDVQDTESEGKEEKYNKKQEEPENNLDPAKDRPRKSRYLCIALKITQLFPGIYKFFLLFNSPSKLRKSLFKISSAIQIYLMFIEHSHT